MEKNYYTPELCEFRNGFSFEAQTNDGGWTPITLDLSNYNLMVNLRHEAMSVQDGFTRVKMLNVEDFEFEGFTLKSRELKPPPYTIDWCHFIGKEIEVKVNLASRMFPFTLNINSLSRRKFVGNFRIKIKNRSELQELLKKLECENK